jgi:geranylgeranyl pyrophosphate synthase
MDLVSGCVTVPMAIALERDSTLKKAVREVWRSTEHEASPHGNAQALAWLRDRMERVGAFAATRELALAAADRARAAVASLPIQLWREQLSAFALASAHSPMPTQKP